MDADPASSGRTTAADLCPGTVLASRYRIVSLLGKGGMGEVYRAEDLKLGQPVALKFLPRAVPETLHRFYNEVRLGRQVAHPNVCRMCATFSLCVGVRSGVSRVCRSRGLG